MRSAIVSPFVREGETIPVASTKAAKDAEDDFIGRVIPGFLALAHHPDLEMRTRAIEVLGARSDAVTEAALVEALSDPEDRVRRAALDALATSTGTPSEKAIAAVVKLARESSDWALRVRATEALGQMGRRADKQVAMDALAALAKNDKYALVREAAVHALATVDASGARTVLADVSKTDAEARVRDAAAAALSGGGDSAASTSMAHGAE
jgi:HEAT repeat protein